MHVEDPRSFGLVVRVIDDVEIPSLIEIMWEGENNVLSRVYADDLIIINSAS